MMPVEVARCYYSGIIVCESCGNKQLTMWPDLVIGGPVDFQCEYCGERTAQPSGMAVRLSINDGKAAAAACHDAAKEANRAAYALPRN